MKFSQQLTQCIKSEVQIFDFVMIVFDKVREKGNCTMKIVQVYIFRIVCPVSF